MHQVASPTSAKVNGEEPPRVAAALTGVCVVAGILGWWFQGTRLALPLNVLAYTAGSVLPALAALQSLSVGRLNVDLLMLVAAAGAAFLGQWSEGVVLLFLFSLSGTLESYATYRTTRSIESLMKLRPREALQLQGDIETLVPIESLHLNDTVRVKPGERFPVDGQIIDGETWADESTLTGESEAVTKPIGSDVFAGTINGTGSVLVRMTRAVDDTTIERIVQLVHEAQATKTPTQKLVEAWQPPYVAAVLVASALTIFGSYYYHNPDWNDAFYHGMTLLVAASPCAVVASAPSVLLSAIARAARLGVLFKGGHQLELLGAVQTVAFDKTGTLTHGKPVVTDVWTVNPDQTDEVLRLAAAVEVRSEHPLAATIVAEAKHRGLQLPKVRDFESHTGHGVHALVEDRWVGVGREGLFDSHDVTIPPEVAEAAKNFRDNGQTAMLVIADGVAVGVIAVADQMRTEAPAAIAALHHLGIERIIILSGDHGRVAQAVSKRAGADEVFAELMPDEKVRELKRLMAGGHLLAMVGDGVNDAPALATANVGIAMGGAGTDVALEIADVVLMRDDLRALPRAVWLGRLARRRVQQNVAFSFAVIATLIGSTFFGLPLWLGVIGHEGSTLLVVLNGVRTLWAKPPKMQ
jgi:Cd2+/Zn2+-exporting ATPase